MADNSKNIYEWYEGDNDTSEEDETIITEYDISASSLCVTRSVKPKGVVSAAFGRVSARRQR